MLTELYINNQLVDLGNGEAVVLLNKQYEDLTNPTNYYVEWSKTIKVPFSRQNNLIFENTFRADSLVMGNSQVDPAKKIPFILLSNNKIMMRGYCKVNVINYAKNDRCYEINLFSTLGEIFHDLKQLTFNANADVDDKYKIPSPFGTEVNAALVKESWNRTTHSLDINSTNTLDYMGFLASYQGCYPDFSSDSEESRMPGETYETASGEDEDEHYEREYRSYYQQPYIWVDKLWQLTKKQFESFSDYKINLSERWFNSLNPYYKDLIYTCPTLYDTTMETAENKVNQSMGASSYYGATPIPYKCHIMEQSDLSNHHRQILKFPYGGANYFCDPNTGLFNGGAVKSNSGILHLSGDWMLFAGCNDGHTDGYCKIRKDNCVYFEFKAVRAADMSEIEGTRFRYQLYSSSTNCSSSGCADTIDVGISQMDHPNVVSFPTVDGHQRGEGFYWTGYYNIDMTVNCMDPFYVVLDVFTANNSKPFETSFLSFMPTWDWLWTDLWARTDYCANCGDRNKGMTFYIPYTSKNQYEGTVNIRSNSAVDLYRVFPKDIAIFDVLLNYSKMFGLYFDLDEESKTLTVMDRNEYFENYEILDWTDKLDRSKSYQLKPISFENKYVNFNYDEGSGQRFEGYQKKYEANYGSKKLNTSYEFNNEVKDLYEGLVPAMICSKKQDSFYFNTHNPSGPNFKGYGYKEMTSNYFVENDNEGSNANMSGAFYFHNGRQAVSPNLEVPDSAGNYSVRITDDSTYQVQNNSYLWSWFGPTQLTQFFPAVSTMSKNNKFSVHFEEPKEYYFNRQTIGDYSGCKYIYPTFWKDYIDERYNIQNKVLTAYFYLTPEDMMTYKFNKFVKVDNVLYLPNKITDFNVNGKTSTKVEMIQVYRIGGYTDSFYKMPYLSVREEAVYVNEDTYTDVIVHSSSRWTAGGRSSVSWLEFTNSGDDGDSLHIKARSQAPATGRSVILAITNRDGLLEHVTIKQVRNTNYLRVSRNTITYSYTGGETSVSYESNPMPVTLVSKPDWVDVSFTSNMLREIPNTFRELDYEMETVGSVSRISFPNANPSVQLTRMENKLLRDNSFAEAFDTMTIRKKALNTVSGLSITGTSVVTRMETNCVVIKTNSRNMTRSSRTGFVTLTNGINTTRIRVTQNCSRTIVIGEVEPSPVHPIHIDYEKDPFELNFRTYKEIVPNSLYISTGTIEKTQDKVIDDMILYAAPVLTRTRSLQDPPDGGVITCDTVDGETVIEHYNTGAVLEKRQVMFRSDGHCIITLEIEGETYIVNEGDVYYEEIPVGTSIGAEVTVSTGHLWKEWSDGNQDLIRNFIVADDDILLTAYTEADDNVLQYDDGVDVAWDESTTISLSDN